MGQTGAEKFIRGPEDYKNRSCSWHVRTRNKPFVLPKGLVGAKCTAEVLIAGQICNCLLDTGSQVTTISQTYYEQNLSHLEIKPLEHLLELEAANGQLVPYLGYIEIDVMFPKGFLGAETKLSTLALVTADTSSSAKSSVLIGTNTLDLAYENHSDAEITVSTQTVPYGFKAILNVLGHRFKQKSNSIIGSVRIMGTKPECVPAGQTLVLEGSISTHELSSDKWVLMESPSETPLPGGLLCTSCLVTLPPRTSQKIPVILKNETEHDILVPAKSVIAELHSLQSVITKEAAMGSSNEVEDAQPFTIDFGDSPIPGEWKKRISEKLWSMPELFALHDLDFGRTDKVMHRIRLQDETPFKHRARPIHPQDYDAVRKHLQELLDAGVIRESESSFSSPIVVVRKKNGDVRLCIDYRKLNLQTIKDAYALPNLEETFSALTGSCWFSVLDLKSGYYQIEVEESDKHKTAFVCPLGFWEFNRMPQGVTNAPSTFQRLMERCMSDIHLKEVVVFIDDLIVFSDTLEEHERRLLRVLSRLKEYGLKLSPEKCKFFQTSVRYLGHIVSSSGVETDPEKVEVLKRWPVPKNLKELRSFLGFSGYYRRFIQDYAMIVKPLNDLTSGYPPLRKGCKFKERKDYHNPKEPFGSRWSASCQLAFESIIEALTTAPVLGFADPKLPYVLHTDASTVGLGAALYQEQDGQLKVIAYASRGLSRSEARYPAHKLEFLSLKWAVTEKFNDYLYGNQFTVVTDSNPLTYLLTSAKLDSTSYRWLSALSTYSFKLQYRAGKQNLDADSLSRRPNSGWRNDITSKKELERIRQFTLNHLLDDDVLTVPAEVIQAICDKHVVHHKSVGCGGPLFALVESLAMHVDAIPCSFDQNEVCDGIPIIPTFGEDDLKEKQRSDPIIREVIQQLETGETIPPSVRKEFPMLPFLIRELKKLELQNGILYRRRQEGNHIQYQLVLPESLRGIVLTCLHDEMGHLGIERTLDLARSRFYWPRMFADVEKRIKTCPRCVCRKSLPEKAAPLVNIHVTRPLELVCMDFLSIEPDSKNTKDVLVITDFFTKYAVAVPTTNQKSRTVAKALWENFIVHYGIPEKLHSDQGADFESKTIKELCELMGIQKIRTTPYHPRGNPVERFNRTLLSMLGTLKECEKVHWSSFVKPLVHAYNCTKHDSTGFTPYELMFGRQPRLPVDVVFDVPQNREQFKTHSQYVSDLKSRLQGTYDLAMRNSAKVGERNKARFDKHVLESTLDIGDRVLVRNVRLRGKHKLADKWESLVYVVVSRAGDLPVYTVKPEGKDSPLRTLHRDLLLPCEFLQLPEEVVVLPRTRKRPPTRRNPSTEVQEQPNSDSDDDIPLELPYRDPLVCTNTRFIEVYETEKRLQNDVLSNHVVQDSVDNISTEDLPVLADSSAEYLPESERSRIDSIPILNYLPVDDPEIVEPEANENVPAVASDTFTNQSIPVEQTERVCEHETAKEQNDENFIRKSNRVRQKPKKFTYPELGNPLISIVQSLFQSLSTAVTDSITESSFTDSSKPVLTQPVSCMHRDVHRVNGGGCNPE